MNTITYLPATNFEQAIANKNILHRFISWCGSQQEKRLMWTGIILPAQACIFAPLTFVVAMFAGIHFALFIPVIAALVITFISNLAALPTKITIPVFIAGIVTDVIVMIIAVSIGGGLEKLF
jgi:hypothetical protein